MDDVKTNDRVAVIVDDKKPAEAPKMTKEQVAILQDIAVKAGAYDPVEEEKRNNEKMFARDRIAREGYDVRVEKEVSAKMISDAEAAVADAQAKLDAAKSAAEKAKKTAEDKEKADKDAAKDAEKKADSK